MKPCTAFACAAALLVIVLAAAGSAQAQETAEEEDPYAAFLEEARSYEIVPADQDAPVELREKPLLNWTLPERGEQRGSVFVWLRNGRPAAVGNIFTYESRGHVHRKHAMHSLVEGSLSVRRHGALIWTPKTGIQWQDFPQTPPPAGTERLRLVQMRRLASQFSVTLTNPGGEKTNLRLLPQPLFRYAAPKAAVLDGALFAFARGTSPDTLLLVETLESEAGLTWRYALARFHFWALDAQLGREPIWSVDEDLTMMINPEGNPAQFEKPYVSFQPRGE